MDVGELTEVVNNDIIWIAIQFQEQDILRDNQTLEGPFSLSYNIDSNNRMAWERVKDFITALFKLVS